MLHKSLPVQPHVVPAQVLALILQIHLMKSQKELIRTLIIQMQPEFFLQLLFLPTVHSIDHSI